MSDALGSLPKSTDPALLVGLETADDAAVYRLTDDVALISTADFITPPVDDPWWFGQVAAANALSDVWAMGGRPVIALSLVMFPEKHLDVGVLKEILRGGQEKVTEAGASIAGGHSVDDLEPKYGLAVSGVVHPDRILTNAAARPGDALVLTKPLGSGVLFNAVRSKRFPYSHLLTDVLPVVSSLNKAAGELAVRHRAHAATDITGFGILGHSLEVAQGSGVRVVLEHAALPFYEGALEMYRKGETTGSNAANRALVECHTEIAVELTTHENERLMDPQTSGGLLISLPAADAPELVKDLHNAGVGRACIVGEVLEGPAGLTVR